MNESSNPMREVRDLPVLETSFSSRLSLSSLRLERRCSWCLLSSGDGRRGCCMALLSSAKHQSLVDAKRDG